MDYSQYDSIDAVNWSTLKEMVRSPAAYRYVLDHPREDNPRFALGRAVHAAVLEPHVFASEYVIYDGRRAGKDWERFRAQHEDRTILTIPEYETARAAAAAVAAHPEVQRLFTGLHCEVPLVWTDPDTGILCKGRMDGAGPEVVLDLKTTKDASARAFGLDAARYQYHGQLAWYAAGLRAAYGWGPIPYLIAVEVSPPYLVAVYRVPDDVLYQGELLYRSYLSRLAECRKRGRWPGLPAGVQDLEFPAWGYQDDDETGLDLSVNGQSLEV